MTIEELQKKCEENDLILDEEKKTQLLEYLRLLQEWNEKINLTAITESEEVIEKHFYDSILPLYTNDIQGCAADIGSGAGFPGLVWKIVRPDLAVDLVEPTGKRCTFLNEVIQKLHLEKIRVINSRAEDHVRNCRESYDVVTARAVANLPLLSELCVPLVKKGGIFLAMKGAQGKEEARQAEHAMKVLGASLEKTEEVTLSSGDTRINLVYRKTEKTPEKYPRNYGQMKKKPL